MPSESYRRVCKELMKGNTSPVVAKEAGMDIHDFTILLKAYRKIEGKKDLKNAQKQIAEKMIESGIVRDEFIRITGYTKHHTLRLYNEILGWNLEETDRSNDLKGLEEICQKFGLNRKRTIKEQWFGGLK